MGHRSTARRIAMQALYQSDIAKIDIGESISIISNQEKISKNASEFAKSLAEGTWSSIAEIDDIIEKFSKDWPKDRMSFVDRNILRLAIYEIKFGKNAPAPVVVNESIKLAQKYGSSDSHKFINGILGEILKPKYAKIQ